MTKKNFILSMLAAGAFLAPMMISQEAQAAGYCREYQKTIRVGFNLQSGYGTACLQPDGSWQIVASSGNVDPFDELRQQNAILVAQQQPVYYTYGPYYQPVVYYAPAPVRYRYARPSFFFSYNNGDHDRGYHNGWNRNNRGRWDHDDHDRHGHH